MRFLVVRGQKLAASWFGERLKRERHVAGVVIIGAWVINVGFFLFSIFSAMYGSEGLSQLATVDVGQAPVSSGLWKSLQRTLAWPILWAARLDLAVNLGRVAWPRFLVQRLAPLGIAYPPLAKLTLGAYLPFRLTHWKQLGLTLAQRMRLRFGLGQGLARLTRLQGLDTDLAAAVVSSGLIAVSVPLSLLG